MLRVKRTLLCALLAMTAISLGANGSAAREAVPYVNAPSVARTPQTYKDPQTGMLFYVESDGRHVVAINSEGQIAWVRNPFVDAGLKPYRVAMPRISYIGAAPDRTVSNQGRRFVAIRFDSSQFGIIDTQTGDFTFEGQD